MTPVLFIGNGPNRLEDGGVSWSDLLVKLRHHVGAKEATEIDRFKPFPLLYEELLLQGWEQNPNMDESEIKQFIAERTSHIKPGNVHQRLMNMGFQHVLTTNYDHALDDVFPSSPAKRKNLGLVNERRYNLFRHIALNDKTKLWHIHGDLSLPETITLGYEQYSGYLQQMRLYTTTGINYSKKEIPSLLSRLKSQDTGEVNSWLDLVFTRDVYILGFQLDFVEFHLWWLLTYRARLKPKSEVPVFNTIYFIEKTGMGESQSKAARMELLAAGGVKVKTLGESNTGWPEFYDMAIDWIQNNAF